MLFWVLAVAPTIKTTTLMVLVWMIETKTAVKVAIAEGKRQKSPPLARHCAWLLMARRPKQQMN